MSFKKNWPNHLTAVLTADGFSHRLAQDFWPEELFNPKVTVRCHWLKLIWVFGISGLVQLALPSALLAVVITWYQNGGANWTWTLMLLGGVVAFAVVMTLVLSLGVWLDLKRHAREPVQEK